MTDLTDFPWWTHLTDAEKEIVIEYVQRGQDRMRIAAQRRESASGSDEPEHEYYPYPDNAQVLADKGALAVAYGYSDDLVELGGLVRDEYDVIDKMLDVTMSNGVRFTAHCDRGGVWRIEVLEGHDKVVLDTLPTSEEASTGRYTDYLWFMVGDETGGGLSVKRAKRVKVA